VDTPDTPHETLGEELERESLDGIQEDPKKEEK